MTDINARIEEIAIGMFYAGLSKLSKNGSRHHGLAPITWENVSEWTRVSHRRMARFAFAEIMAKDSAGVARSRRADLVAMWIQRDFETLANEASNG